MERNKCPVCGHDYYTKPMVYLLAQHPYVQCLACSFWYQKDLIPKMYEAPTERERLGDSMPDYEKEINRSLAIHLINYYEG